ncbi:MAG: glycosyltransferase family 2 protein [Selenomonadaceae bacterium]|nr:glycosyltransferase family 2 protein [Selenomonadaceae bacterium]
MKDILFENEVALVLIVKNESRYIKEWLEYHYRIGVDKFYIYNNDSDDRSELLKILEPWIDAGVVDFEDASGKYRQMPVYNDAIERHRFDCRYMGFIDTDEFIYIKTGQTLPEFLHDHFGISDDIAGLSMNWRMFGTSGLEKYEPIDVIERFTRRAPDNYYENLHIKTIANPRRIFYMPFPHNAQYMIYSECCDENLFFVRNPANERNPSDKIQVNHYYTKSVEEYSQKYSRGRADCPLDRNEMQAFKQELNIVEDIGLRNLWCQLKSQPLPQPIDHSSRKILENINTMLKPFMESDIPIQNFQGQVTTLMTCFFTIERCDLISPTNKSRLRNMVLEFLTKSISTRTTVIDLTLLLAILPQILCTEFPATKEFLSTFKMYLPRLILEYQNELESVAGFHARHVQALLELI